MQTLDHAKSQAQKAQAVVNEAKWEAARAWTKDKGMIFRVVTEDHLFRKPQKQTKRKKRK